MPAVFLILGFFMLIAGLKLFHMPGFPVGNPLSVLGTVNFGAIGTD